MASTINMDKVQRFTRIANQTNNANLHAAVRAYADGASTWTEALESAIIMTSYRMEGIVSMYQREIEKKEKAA